MFAAEILDHIKRAGLTITVIDDDRLLVEPKSLITDPIREQIRQHKADLIKLLSGEHGTEESTPAPCRDCSRVEVLTIMGKAVAGCLYLADGEFSEGWRRIPAGTERCIC